MNSNLQDVPNETIAKKYRLYEGIGDGFDHAPTLHSIRHISNLTAALYEINRRSVGCDGFPWMAYVEPILYLMLNPNFVEACWDGGPLQTIQQSLNFHARPDAVFSRTLKSGRVIQIGTVKNRLVERAFARKLAHHFDPYLSDSSCAFRCKMSTVSAALAVRSTIRNGNFWVLKTDIRHFFDNVRRDILRRQLLDSVDEQVCERVLEAISPFHIQDRMQIEEGLPQGNGLSPVLSNLYLHRFDLACSHLRYCRYADDLVILGETEKVVQDAKEFITTLLASLGLHLNEQKTRICDLRRLSIDFLGFEVRGGKLYPSEKSISRLEQKLQSWGHKACQNPRLRAVIVASLTKGFVERFRIGPVRKLFRRLDRRFKPHYPGTTTLAGLFDGEDHLAYPVSVESLRSHQGEAAVTVIEKAHYGQVPTIAAAGEQRLTSDATPPPGMCNGDFMQLNTMRNPKYLNFIRTRFCWTCGGYPTEPHHARRTLAPISSGGVGSKGSDYLSIPLCRTCHGKVHSGKLRINTDDLMKAFVIYLVSFIAYREAQRRSPNRKKTTEQ